MSCLLVVSISFFAHGQVEKVKSSLDLEDAIAANYFLKFVESSTERSILEVEILIVEEDYQRASEVLEKLNQSSLINCDQGRYYSLVALINHKQNNYEISMKNFKKAEVNLKKCRYTDKLTAEFNYLKGYCSLEQNQLMVAEQSLYSAQQYFKNDSLMYYIKSAKIYFWLGTIKLKQENYNLARYWFSRSLSILENTPLDKTKTVIKVYNNIGNAWAREDNYREAIANYSKAIQLNKNKIVDPDELAISCSNMGRFYDSFENYLKAKEWYEEAFHWISKSNLDPARKALILQNYGTCLTNNFEHTKALTYYFHALDIINPYQSTFGEIYCRILLNITNTYSNLDQEEESEKINLILQEFIKKNKSQFPKQFNEWQLWRSTSLIKEKKFSDAIEILEDLEISIKTEEDAQLYDILLKKADCLFFLSKFSEARIIYKRILNFNESLFLPVSHPRLIFYFNEIGKTFLEESNLDSARFFFQKAKGRNQLLTDKKLTNDLYSSKIEWIVSNFYMIKVDITKFNLGISSIENLKQVEGLIFSTLAVIDSKRIELSNESDLVNLHRMTRDFFDVAMEYYFILYKETGNKEYIDKAFFISEKTKYQALHQSMKLDRVNAFAGVTNRVLQEENNLAKQMSQLEYQYSQELARQEEPLPELVEEYITGWKANSTRYDKLIDSIRNNLPNYYNLKFNKATVEINQIQSDLLSKDHNTAWISYYFGAETCYAIVISDTEKHFINLGLSESIARLTKSFNNYVTHQAGEESLQTSNNLYKKLLHPVDSSINKSKRIKKIVIIPDDVLNYLNFELLTKPGQKDRHYALFDYQFSYGYSSTLLWAEFSEQLKWNASTLNMVGFAPEFIAQSKNTGEVSREGSENSNYDSFDFSPLSKNQEEVQQVSEILRHKKAKTSLYLGSKADESSFKKADLTNVNIIHLATHGFVSNNQKGVAGIAFAKNDGSTDDGILYMDEIFSLRNRANLVCLSACETGGGILNNGEGLLGLTRAFIYSGSQNLVVSLWKVQDESTAQLMTSFYSNLVKKQSISSSLRSAKLEMIKKNPSIHPYYWSAFIHIGLN